MTLIKIYDSIAEMQHDASMRNAWNDTWGTKGYDTQEVCYRKALIGDTRLVPQAEAMMERLEAQIQTPRRQWVPSPAGAYPIVPDYIMGRPTPMRRPILTGNETAPITVYVRPNAYAYTTPDALRKRGTAILSLVMALSGTRPITLWYYFVGDSKNWNSYTVIAAKINTAPLDVAQACYTLTDPTFYRGLTMGLATHLNGFRGGPVISQRIGEEICYNDMGNDPASTLVVGPATGSDLIDTNPIEWCNQQVKRFTEMNEELVS